MSGINSLFVALGVGSIDELIEKNIREGISKVPGAEIVWQHIMSGESARNLIMPGITKLLDSVFVKVTLIMILDDIQAALRKRLNTPEVVKVLQEHRPDIYALLGMKNCEGWTWIARGVKEIRNDLKQRGLM